MRRSTCGQEPGAAELADRRWPLLAGNSWRPDRSTADRAQRTEVVPGPVGRDYGRFSLGRSARREIKELPNRSADALTSRDLTLEYWGRRDRFPECCKDHPWSASVSRPRQARAARRALSRCRGGTGQGLGQRRAQAAAHHRAGRPPEHRPGCAAGQGEHRAEGRADRRAAQGLPGALPHLLQELGDAEGLRGAHRLQETLKCVLQLLGAGLTQLVAQHLPERLAQRCRLLAIVLVVLAVVFLGPREILAVILLGPRE